MHFGAILEVEKSFKLLFIVNVHILRSEDGCFTVTGTKAKNITLLTLGIIQLRHPQKMTNTFNDLPTTPYTKPLFAKMNSRSVGKNNRIQKLATNFKTSFPPFCCVDVKCLVPHRQ